MFAAPSAFITASFEHPLNEYFLQLKYRPSSKRLKKMKLAESDRVCAPEVRLYETQLQQKQMLICLYDART
jgi:hypothetical protein